MNKFKKEFMCEISDASAGYVVVLVILLLAALAFAVGLQGILVYLVWNFGVVWLFPTLPVLTFGKACVAGIFLSIIGSFFRGGK